MSAYKYKRHEVFNSACAMAARHLMRSEGLHLLSKAELAQVLETTEYMVESLLKGENIISSDLSAICDSLGIDIGISIRKPSGEEITFYPSQNFGLANDSLPTRTAKQEIPVTTAEATTPGMYGPPYKGLYSAEED